MSVTSHMVVAFFFIIIMLPRPAWGGPPGCDYSGAKKVALTSEKDWIQRSIDRHNEYRAQHGVCPLVYNQALSEVAQMWANQLAATKQFEHSHTKCLGENLAEKSSTGAMTTVDPNFAVDGWYDEIKDYDFNSGKSTGGQIGHLTQLLWQDSREIGMAFAPYTDGSWNKVVVVAEYFPQGNYVGENPKHVFPKGTAVPAGCQQGPPPLPPPGSDAGITPDPLMSRAGPLPPFPAGLTGPNGTMNGLNGTGWTWNYTSTPRQLTREELQAYGGYPQHWPGASNRYIFRSPFEAGATAIKSARILILLAVTFVMMSVSAAVLI